MENEQLQDGSSTKKIILIVIALIVAGAGGYLGYRQIMNWHNRELNTVEQERQLFEDKSVVLEEKVNELQDKLAAHETPPVPEDRVAEAFGETPALSAQETCDALKSKIASYFNYLDQKDYVKPYVGEGNAYQFYAQMIMDLSKNLPMVTDEKRDIVSLTHNSAHFFRVLNKNRILFVKDILTNEKDILEPTLANFYEFYTSGECCKDDKQGCPSPEVLYEYAGFFLNTLSGKSYLMRRDSKVRTLITYYSILILDRANNEILNKYGIDIRPHIDLSLNDISNQKKLLFQKQYVTKLQELKEKYQPAAPVTAQ